MFCFVFLLLQILSLRRSAEALKPCEHLQIWGETTQNFSNWPRGILGVLSLRRPLRLRVFIPTLKKIANKEQRSEKLMSALKMLGGKISRARRGRGCAREEGILQAGLVRAPGAGLPYCTGVISLIFLFRCWF